MVAILYNLRSLFVRRLTSLATLGGVALVTFVLAGALMLARGAERAMSSGGREDVAIVLRSGSDSELASSVDTAAVQALRAAPGVAAPWGEPNVSPELVGVIALQKTDESGISNLTVRGVGERAFGLRPTLSLVSGRFPRPGSDEAIVGQRVVGHFEGLEVQPDGVGGEVLLGKNRPVHVVGVFRAPGDSAESELWVDLETARAAFGRTGLASSVRVELSSASELGAFREAVESDRRLGLDVTSEALFLEAQASGLSSFIRVLGTLVSAMFAIAAMLGAAITMHGAVASRSREIGTLRALGFSRGKILAGFLLESCALTLGGATLGVVCALPLKWVEVSMMNQSSWSEVVFGFDPSFGVLFQALVFGAAMGLVGGIAPALRAAWLRPLDALRA
ncbi:MAG: ABC transporter permease [Myxococcales bacterium]|nr:ABC transporter permease [Myxococcales bacterium]